MPANLGRGVGASQASSSGTIVDGMAYFYHGIPEDMKGSELIPLNKMLEVDADLRAKYLEKYKGREEILERKIPLLNCLWNDVVQLLPLHPYKLFELQKELGLIDEIPDYRYFQIPLTLLDPQQTVVYFKTAPGEENVTVKWLKDVNLDELQETPEATKQYYTSMVGTSEPVFNYQFVPHIIYRGTVDVSGAETITLR
ncbi:hypothetical protein BH23PAT2_BH23PAT2_09770 [soil metagenome]